LPNPTVNVVTWPVGSIPFRGHDRAGVALGTNLEQSKKQVGAMQSRGHDESGSARAARASFTAAYDYYRDEEMNANNFFSNATLTPRAPYRYRMTGWSLGGPLFSQELIGSPTERKLSKPVQQAVGHHGFHRQLASRRDEPVAQSNSPARQHHAK
jgi:hypothetical protein